MNVGEAFADALENLSAHKLRSTLSMLGMIFGVGAVIAMLSIGAGAEREALRLIERLGLRNVLVRAKSLDQDELFKVRKKSPGLSARDVAAIREAVPGVRAIDPRIALEVYRVRGEGTRCEARVIGVSARHADLAHLTLEEGRFLDERDEKTYAQVCVIGASVRRELFGFEAALGRDLKVNDVWLEVIGVLAPQPGGASSFEGVPLGSSDQEIYLPSSTAARKFERNPIASPLDEVVVQVAEWVSPRETAAVLRALLDRLHSGAADYDVVVPEALLDQSRKTQRLFNIVMGCIAGISLVVGGIGIMNIMLATILERTREIGVRRALGARRQDIRFQFIIESFSISLLGGLAGIAMGLVIARTVALWAGWPTVVTLLSILLSTGVSLVVGLASGIYPAVRAAKLDPIEALRYE